MSDSGRYDVEDTLARALFAAGRDEAPSAHTLQKALKSVGAAAGILSAAELAQASAAVTARTVAAVPSKSATTTDAF